MLGIQIDSEDMDSWLKGRAAWKNELPIGTFVIDVTFSMLYECRMNKSKGCKELVVPGEARLFALFSKIPNRAKENLKSRLQAVFEQEMQSHWLTPGRRRSLTPDSPLKKLDISLNSLDDITSTGATDDDSSTMEIRDAFLCFMVDLLGPYQNFIVKPSSNLNDEVYRSLDEEFMKTRYIDKSDRANRALLTSLCGTQMFAAFIQQRQEGRNPGAVFFERAVIASRSFKYKPPLPLYPLAESVKRNQFDLSVDQNLSSTPRRSAGVTDAISPKRKEIFYKGDLHLHRGGALIIPGPETPAEETDMHQPSEYWSRLDEKKLLKEQQNALSRLGVLRHLANRHVVEVRSA